MSNFVKSKSQNVESIIFCTGIAYSLLFMPIRVTLPLLFFISFLVYLS
nr:MAG TPA: hypothetical protein [Caudoviricetes sp.]